MKNDNKRKRNNTIAGNTNNGTKKNNNNKKKKRLSKEEYHKEEKESKYSKLVYASAKSIRKEAKICKAFECQKIIRKIKALKTSLDDSPDENNNNPGKTTTEPDVDTKTKESSRSSKEGKEKDVTKPDKTQKLLKKIRNLEKKLRLTRAFELDELVNVCLTRLGLDFTKNTLKSGAAGNGKNSNNNKGQNNYQDCEENNDDVEGKNKNKDDEKSEQENKTFYESLIESMLQHKKMITAIESVNASTSQYNSWLSRREEWVSGQTSKSKNKKTENHRTIDVAGHDGDTGLFIDSLAGEGLNCGDGQLGDEGEEGQKYDMYTDRAPKKNRMGQRARKAKAMALEAKKAGKPWDDSIKKWWELKPKNARKEKVTNELASGLDASKTVRAAQIVEMGSNWKEVGKAHPSWAARQIQKSKSGSGIGDIEFKGKKTTFA